MNKDLITVLDLGSTKAACIAAEQTETGALRVKAAATVPCKGVKRGVVTDLEATSMAIDDVIRRVQQTMGEEINEVVVGIGGQHVEGLNAQGFVPIYPQSRSINSDDVLQVINHSRQVVIPPDREQIQAIPREFRVNGQRGITKPVGMSGSKLEVITYLVTGHSPHIQNLERAVSMTGRKVSTMVLQPLASGLGILTMQDMELGCVVVDIGGGTTEVAVFHGGSIAHSASIPIGGQLVTSDLSKLLKVSIEEAERLKLESGAALARLVDENEGVNVMQLGQTQSRPMQRRVLCEIIESRMRELAAMVRQQIEKSGLYGVLPAGVIVTGGASLMPGTEQLFESVLQHLRVRRGAPQLGGTLRATTDRPEFSTAVGLARYAMENEEEEISTLDSAGKIRDRVRTIWAMFSGK